MRCRPTGFLVLAALLLGSNAALAQTGTVSGFVTDRSDGQALEGATVALYRFAQAVETSPSYGTATNSDGLYLITRIRPGRYVVAVSFLGYRSHRDTLEFNQGQVRTVTVALVPEPESMTEVLVESERTTGAARVTAGHQRIRPQDIELVPAPDITADLANYLTTLPGIVTTGDRGGQFFVRGGEPSQNLVLLDGMTVYQPFHLLGFYSAFPAEVIDRVDFHAGGFGAEYAGRLSSVIDVVSRPGNNRRFAGVATASPFTGALMLEGPIVPGHASFLVSARESFIDRTGNWLSGEDLPFRFGDAFAKIHAVPGERSRLSATFLRTYDRGSLVPEVGQDVSQEISWKNNGFSVTWLLLPKSLPVASRLTVSRAYHQMIQGQEDAPVRFSSIRSTRIALDGTFSEGPFLGAQTTTKAGWDVELSYARNRLGGLFQNIEDAAKSVPAFGLYVEPDMDLGAGIRLRPGLRVHWYNVRHSPYLEPRLTAEWQAGVHHFSAAAGIYQQQLLGLSDRRDAASVFTAWTGIPRSEPDIQSRIGSELLRGRIGRAVHVLVGYRSEPARWIEYSFEGFYKRNTNLFVGEWTAFPRFTTKLQPATGESIGLEARVEMRRGPVYGYVAYGLSSTVYAAEGRAVKFWYGTESLRYHPAHDRRHQVSMLASVRLLEFDLSLRWQFGSGLPYTRPIAFDGFALVEDVSPAFDLAHSRRVIYERPFDSLLPTYHRLDASLERTWRVRDASLTLQVSAINLYDRRNIFYIDTFTLQLTDQLPFVPSVGVKVAFG